MSLTVLVSDADDIMVRLLAADLQRQGQFEVFGCPAVHRQLRSLISDKKPHVLLLSLHARDSMAEAVSLLRGVHHEFPWLRTIVLSEGSERDLVLGVFRGGAKGFFDRSAYDPAVLCRCIQCVAEGQIWAKSEQLCSVLDAFATTRHFQANREVQFLTPRESEVSRLVCDGLSNSETAKQLGLSVHTVKNYLFSIFDKVGVSNRAELILYMLSNNAPSKKLVTRVSAETLQRESVKPGEHSRHSLTGRRC